MQHCRLTFPYFTPKGGNVPFQSWMPDFIRSIFVFCSQNADWWRFISFWHVQSNSKNQLALKCDQCLGHSAVTRQKSDWKVAVTIKFFHFTCVYPKICNMFINSSLITLFFCFQRVKVGIMPENSLLNK